MTITRDPLADAVSHATDIPVRSITLSCEDPCILTASKPSAVISAVTHPANAAAQPLDWKVTNAEGVSCHTPHLNKLMTLTFAF